jgi:hypothetical protein
MAYSFQTGGYAFAPVLAKVDEQSLAGLKPISFSGGGQSPVQFRPTAGINVPSSRPELIGQGIASGLGSIAQGIQAAFKSKADEKRDLLKFEREKEVARIKMKAESDYRQQSLNETKRYHDMLSNQVADRVKNVGGNKGKSLATRSLDGLPPLPESKQQDNSLDFGYPSIKGGGDFTKPLSDKELDNQVEQMEGAGGAGQEIPKIESSNPPLADLTSPQGIEAAPDLRGEAALYALSAIPWEKIESKYLSASVGVPSENTPVRPNEVFNSPKSTTSRLANLGGISNAELSAIGSYLDKIPAYRPENTAAEKAMEDAIGIDAVYSEREALALRNYAKTKGIPANLKATENGYEVSWPSQSEIENYRENVGGKKAAGTKKPEDIFKEEEQLRGDFVAQSKNFQVLQSAWNNLKGKLDNPTGASDMSLIFAYMKLLDPTSTIREGEYATASNVGTIPQTFVGKYNKAIEGNGFLDPKVRESFIKEAKGMYKSSLSQHKQSTEEYKRIAKSYGLDPDRVIINLVTKDEADQAAEEMEALRQELSAVAVQDRATYPNFNSKKERYKALKKAQDQNKSLEQPNTQTPSTPQTPNATNQGIFSNYFKAPPIF